MVDGGNVCAQVVGSRDSTSGSAFVGSGRAFSDHVVEEHFVFDVDLQLLGSVFGEHVHQVHVGLIGQHVVDLHAKVLALVHLHILEDRSGDFVRQVLANSVVGDADRRSQTDTDGIALVLQLAFVIGVSDFRQHGVLIELGQQFAGPQGGDESAGVRGVRVERRLDGIYSSHDGLLKSYRLGDTLPTDYAVTRPSVNAASISASSFFASSLRPLIPRSVALRNIFSMSALV